MGNETGRFKRSDRLLDSRDFVRVLRQGRRRSDSDVVVISALCRKNDNQPKDLRGSGRDGSRIGITASRKIGCAVVRNRFKRRVRAWFRVRRVELSEDRDFVVIARRSGAALSYNQLDRQLSRLTGLAYES
ncbi:MAG TPA: ribonuclease P protein component [Myxococcales bacterium]|nr:ribonuclease P protein component [Myxococcales bacterium]HIK85070.1 ribonuclease P protein component [Myxococcales bacterium]